MSSSADTQKRINVKLQHLTAVVGRIDSLFTEIRNETIHPSVNYAVQGVGALHKALVRARNVADRACTIQADAFSLRAQARRVLADAEGVYQPAYDEIVVGKAPRLDKAYSWEERASFYRTDAIDIAACMHECRTTVAYIDDVTTAIDVKAKGLLQARFELDAIGRTLQFANQLGELT